MLIHPTIERLHALHLAAMAQAFDQQRASSQHADLSFEDRVGLLVEAEWTAREQRRLTQRLRHAKLRYPASLEDVDFTTPRATSAEYGRPSRSRMNASSNVTPEATRSLTSFSASCGFFAVQKAANA